MLSQSGAHQLVVDMILVSLEDRLVVQQTDDDNSYDVKSGTISSVTAISIDSLR